MGIGALEGAEGVTVGLGRTLLGTESWGLWDWDACGFGGGCGARRVPCRALRVVVEFEGVVIYEGLGRWRGL